MKCTHITGVTKEARETLKNKTCFLCSAVDEKLEASEAEIVKDVSLITDIAH